MAATDEVTELLQNVTVDTQPNIGDSLQMPSSLDMGVSEDSQVGNAEARSSFPMHEAYIEPGMYYATNGYLAFNGYYCGGYECPLGDWDGVDGIEMQVPCLYSENGSMLYHTGGYGYTTQPIYDAYTPGTPMPGFKADGQLYCSQKYPYPGHMYQQPAPPGAQFMPSASPVNMGVPASNTGPTSSADVAGNINVDGSNGRDVMLQQRPSYPVALLQRSGPHSHGFLPVNGLNPGPQDAQINNYDVGRARSPWSGAPRLTELQQRQGRPQPLPVHPLYGQTLRHVAPVTSHVSPGQPPQIASRVGHVPGRFPRAYQPSQRMYSRANVRGRGSSLELRGNGRWMAIDKGKPRGRGDGAICNGNGSMDFSAEQNQGPQIIRVRSQRPAPGLLRWTRAHSLPQNCDTMNFSVSKEKYNQPDFPTNYDHARFFIIKSYSEDDVHKSIKYNVWASTPNGNKKLNAAYEEARQITGDCPIFLFFSVNASGQFCGVAEMVGPVDFETSMDFWQQDKWTGKFPVKWHMIKDVPNIQFRHIILENNDNKPVTNSRDTQEVKYEQGLEMLKIFKKHAFEISILDDFQFYDNRQKAMQEKRTKQQPQQIAISTRMESNQTRAGDKIACELQEEKLNNEENENSGKMRGSFPAQGVAYHGTTGRDDVGKIVFKQIKKKEPSSIKILSENGQKYSEQ